MDISKNINVKNELEVKFLTNLPEQYQIPMQNFITIPISYDKTNLNELLKKLLKQFKKKVESDKKFEFFIENKIVETDILTLLSENSLLKEYSEKPLEIYYFFEMSEPKLINTIKEDEWIRRIVCRNRENLDKYAVGLFNSEVSFYDEKFEKIVQIAPNSKDEEEGRVDFLNDLLFYRVEKTNFLIMSSRFESEKLKIFTVDFKSKKTENILKEYKQSDEHIVSLSANLLSPQFFTGGDTLGNLNIYKIEDGFVSGEKEIPHENPKNNNKKKKRDFQQISPVSTIEKCHNEIKSVKWINTNQIATIGNDFNVKVFNINTNAQFCVLSSGFSAPSALNSNSEYLFSGHEDGKTRVWDLRTPVKPAFVFQSHENYVSDVKVSPFSSQLFSTIGYDGTVKMFDMRASKPLWKVQTDNQKNFALEFHSAKYLLVGGESANVNVYENNI